MASQVADEKDADFNEARPMPGIDHIPFGSSRRQPGTTASKKCNQEIIQLKELKSNPASRPPQSILRFQFLSYNLGGGGIKPQRVKVGLKGWDYRKTQST